MIRVENCMNFEGKGTDITGPGIQKDVVVMIFEDENIIVRKI